MSDSLRSDEKPVPTFHPGKIKTCLKIFRNNSKAFFHSCDPMTVFVLVFCCANEFAVDEKSFIHPSGSRSRSVRKK